MADYKVGDKVKHVIRGTMEITHGPFGEPTSYVARDDSGMEKAVVARNLTALPAAYTVGDRVRYGASVVTIMAGPFLSASRSDTEFWVVELASGGHATPRTTALTPLPAAEPVKVGDTVRVVEDDLGIRSGEFVGLVGTVAETGASYDMSQTKVRFGDGTGRHGDKANGHWWCRKVEKVDAHIHDGVAYDLSAKYRDRDGDVWRFEDIDGTVAEVAVMWASTGTATPWRPWSAHGAR